MSDPGRMNSLSKQAATRLSQEAGLFALEVAAELKSQTGVSFDGLTFMRSEKKWLLLNWKAMMEKHHVGLPEVIEILLQRYSRRTHDGKIQLLAVHTMTGPAAWSYVADQILLRYPGGENISVWKNDLQRSAALLPLVEVTSEDPRQFVDEYYRMIDAEQSKSIAREASKEHRSRQYRSNPFAR